MPRQHHQLELGAPPPAAAVTVRPQRAPAKRKPRQQQRRMFRGDVEGGAIGLVIGQWRLTIRGGAWVRTIDADGNQVGDDVREPAKALWTNIGDHLVISSTTIADDPTLDAVAAVQVVAVEQSGTPIVRRVAGLVPTGPVWVMPGAKARPR